MRRSINIVAILMICIAGLCAQSSAPSQDMRGPFPMNNQPLSAEEWRLKLIERLMSLPSPVTNGAVQLAGMGDEAAVDVLKVLGEKKEPLTATEMSATVDILHMAFARPESIINPVNRKPHAAVFLLQHLSDKANDGPVRDRIAQEMTRLRSIAAAGIPRPQQ